MQDYITLPCVKLSENTTVPEQAYAGDAGIDLSSIEEVVLKPFERKLVATGLACAIPNGYAGFVLPRSGSAIKQGLSIVNAPGLVDSGYRGELKVVLINLDPQNEISIKPGDRIAQLVVMKVETPRIDLVDKLDETERGTGGFGSSGI